MTMQDRLATGRQKWTPEFPHLGTGPVSYDDCTSPAFFADEREAIFRRWWLFVGREERLPRPGTYFTRELPGLASLVIVRDLEGQVRAMRNICAHRGNKVVWIEHPGEESSGSCRAFHCKYHGWRYGLDGRVDHVTNESQFFDLDTDTLGLPPVACEVFNGFVFVSLADDPPPLREFLGEEVCRLESYPFQLMTQRYGFSTRVHGNWKLSANTIQEWYHPAYVHQTFLGLSAEQAEQMVPPIDAYHYDFFDRHFLNSVPGPPPLKPRAPGEIGPAERNMRWVYKLFRAGLFGPDDIPDLGPFPDSLNPGGIASWSNDHYWLLPNFSLQIWARGMYITYTYWPESVDSHVYDVDLYFAPPKTLASGWRRNRPSTWSSRWPPRTSTRWRPPTAPSPWGARSGST